MNDFHIDQKSGCRDGRRSACKLCINEQNRAIYHETKCFFCTRCTAPIRYKNAVACAFMFWQFFLKNASLEWLQVYHDSQRRMRKKRIRPYNEAIRNRERSYISNLSDRYIRNKLRTLGTRSEDITSELIEAKRSQLLNARLLRAVKKN